MGAVSGVVSRLRRPEYVAENRCVPCTVANIGIAALVSIGIGVLLWAFTTPAIGFATGILLFALSVAAIYLRGYLIPGTPELTRRYFPQWLLGIFGKEPVVQDDTGGDIDQEAVLMGVNALKECRDGTDLCLVDDFKQQWFDEIERVKTAADYDALLSIVGVDTGTVTLEEHGSSVQPQVDGRFAGVWKSLAAFQADIAGAAVLSERLEGWQDIDPHDRHALLAGIRLFLDECPSCGAAPEMGSETVKTCCASRDVMTLECPECAARLFETTAK